MTDLEHGVALLMSLACLAGAGGLAAWFWRGRAQAPFGAFCLFFAVLALSFAWLGLSDFLALIDAPRLARGPWRALVFRGGIAAAIWVLAAAIWRVRGRRN